MLHRLHSLLAGNADAAIAWSSRLLIIAPICVLGAVALGLLLRRRPWLAGLAAALFLIAAGGALAARTWIAHDIGGERFAVLQAMAARPHQPWPRGAGHVPLGAIGAAPKAKAWLEP